MILPFLNISGGSMKRDFVKEIGYDFIEMIISFQDMNDRYHEIQNESDKGQA